MERPFFVIFVSLLSGLGIYIGRYMRFNSWDVWDKPKILLYDIFQHLSQPHLHPRTWGVTILFGVFLCFGYLIFVNLTQLKSMEKAD